MAVGDRLAPRAQVGVDADRLPAAAVRQPEAAAHVVEDQCGARVVAHPAQVAGEGGVDELLVDAGIVAEGRYDDRRQVVPGGGHRGVDRRDVVEHVVGEMRPVLGHHTGGVRGAPWRRTVIRPGGDEHLAPTRRGASHRDARGGGVGAVLLEDRPVGVAHHTDHPLGQFHGEVRRPVLAVGLLGLGAGRGLDRRVAMAEDDRSVAAHEVDVLVAVDVPHAAAVAALHELREPVRQRAGALMPVHPVRDDSAGPLPPGRVESERMGGGGHDINLASFVRNDGTAR